MSRRKIKRGTHKERPHGHLAARQTHHQNLALQEQRLSRNETDDTEMARLVANGSVDATRLYDAKYVCKTARELGWNRTRFEKSLYRVAAA